MTQRSLQTRDDDRPQIAEFSPAVDIYDQPEEIVLVADMPGVAPDAVDIHLDRGELSIRGHVTPTSDEGEAVFQEYQVGDFVRTFTLTEDIDPQGITAEMTNGVLTLRLPKPSERKPRKIPVRGA